MLEASLSEVVGDGGIWLLDSEAVILAVDDERLRPRLEDVECVAIEELDEVVMTTSSMVM